MNKHRRQKNLIKEVNKPVKSRGSKLYVLGSICGLLIIASIFLTIQTSSNGLEIASLQNKEKEAIKKQQELQQTLVETLSRKKLEEKSSELGFGRITNLVYVNDLNPGPVTANASSKAEPVANLR
jgi:hypothetical protein